MTPAEIAAARSGRSSTAYNPLKAAKQASAQAAAGAGGVDFEVGDQVTHGKFGFGTVVDVDDRTVTVMFETAGQKKLARGIAPIKKV